METRANYTLVGAFVVFFLVAIVAFILWIAQTGFSRNVTEYDLYFSGSVTGLKEGSTVLYRGVPVGIVSSITLDPYNIEKVQVTVRVKKAVAVKEDTYASLETQGITGVSYIQLNGGTCDAKRLLPKQGKARAIIPTKSSVFEEVTASLPMVLQKVSKTLEKALVFFTEENQNAFSETLQNIRAVTKSFVPSEENKGEFHVAMKAFQEGIKEMKGAAVEIKAFLNENRYPVQNFTASGLPALTKFLIEGQETLAAVRRLSESLERSPSRFIYNDPKQGVKVP